MREKVLAERYARALLDLGLEEKSLDRFQEEIGRVVEVLKLEPRLLSLLSFRQMERSKREQILKDLMLKLYLSPFVQNFLKLLFAKGRIELFPQVAESFEELVRQIDRVVVANVQVASSEAVASLKGELKKALEEVTGRKVDCRVEENPTLIGGMKVQVGDKIYDASIAGELNRIQEEWI